MKVKTKYGTVNVKEDDMGAVTVSFETMDNTVVEMRSTNSIIFHVLKPRTNKVKTIKDISDLEC